MIYELCCLVNSDASEAEVAKVNEIISSSVKDFSGELVLEDNWGVKTLAQPTSSGKTKANFQYFVYKAENADLNKEILRRLKISDHVLKYGVFSLGDDSNTADVLKNFKTPFSKKYNGSITDTDGEDAEGGKRDFPEESLVGSLLDNLSLTGKTLTRIHGLLMSLVKFYQQELVV